ncbi:hypothetical protein CWI37_1357p0010 [Hamiltosporidium tvaerminnensis]|uniref:Uncharacterized protein n=1 Tax=Hamiltosporidium tvaerminnensis TaxID=1176355 RepID=A0A4V2JUA5_9MICR|nr:hypothetical protein CWI37_1357p0010 [Hamiltosporidium tvaerminnensis]
MALSNSILAFKICKSHKESVKSIIDQNLKHVFYKNKITANNQLKNKYEAYMKEEDKSDNLFMLETCVIKRVGIHGELTLKLKQAGNEEDKELTININEDSDLREEKMVVKKVEENAYRFERSFNP